MFDKMGFDFEFKVPKVLKSVRYSLAAVNGVFLVSIDKVASNLFIVNFSREHDKLFIDRYLGTFGLEYWSDFMVS